MKEKTKPYTAADFARYHSGTMPAGDMHLLEKASLEDPFLADALEGYANVPATERDLAELRARLGEKAEKKKIFTLPSFYAWWRIAALIIIVAGTAYFFYSLNESDRKKLLTKNETKIPATNQVSPAPGNNDSPATNTISSESELQAAFEQKEKTGLEPLNPSGEKDEAVRVQNTIPATSSIAASKTKSGLYADPNNKKETENAFDNEQVTANVLKRKVTHENSDPGSFTSITDMSIGKDTVSRAERYFDKQLHDSATPAIASATRYLPKSSVLKKDSPLTNMINQREQGLNEVVVTGYGTRKKTNSIKSIADSLNGKVAGMKIAMNTLKPVGGKEKFDLYIKNNAYKISTEKGEHFTGEVVLSFTIDKKGRPRNIKVLESSCEPCEQQGIKLLENGPGWIGKKDGIGTVTVKFAE